MKRRRPRQLDLALRTGRGGPRTGAGRKPIPGRRRPPPHRARPAHKAAHPAHVTLRARAGLPSLRAPRVFESVSGAIARAHKPSFRVVHFSVQGDHVHLMVEAHDKDALSRGVRGLAIRIARAVNRALGRAGGVWGDRYHARDLKTPREVCVGIVYVLMNIKKHRPSWTGLDRCSSAPWFDGFRGGPTAAAARSATGPPPTCAARTWLAATGWRRHGLIDFREAPKRLE
jgi:REP element-mobilizing transposase RayT